jgi:carboxypeptidase C (cathepsin A)
MHKSLLATVFAVAACFACAASAPAHAESAKAKTGSGADFQLPPLPAAASKAQSIAVDGRTLNYTVTVGWLPVRDDKGKTIAQVVYTAYTAAGKNRPVTFAFNGGPGAASVFLNMGAIGPKIVNFGVNGD